MTSILGYTDLLMDDSRRRMYLRPADIVRGLVEAGLRAEPADYWPYPFRLRAEQVALIRQHKAEDGFSARRGKHNMPAVAPELAARHFLSGRFTHPLA